MPDFSASDSLLGYFYQVRYALYFLLKIGNTQPKTQLSIQIEGLDDITVYTAKELYELLQTKHIKDTNKELTNSSEEFWKSIRIWSTHFKEGKIFPPDTILTLVITSKIAERTIMNWLRPDDKSDSYSVRDPKQAIQEMEKFANRSKAKDRKNFDAFLALNKEQKIKLVNAIQVLELSPKIGELEQEIKELLLLTVREQHMNMFFDELDSWWFRKIVKQLLNKSGVVTYQELRGEMQDLRDKYTKDSIPLFDSQEPILPKDVDDYQFVRQLEAIGYDSYKKRAKEDYFKAYRHRARWVSEGFLSPDQISHYDDNLVEEWDDKYSKCLDKYKADKQSCLVFLQKFKIFEGQKLQKIGQNIYDSVSDATIHIHPERTEKFIMRGSYHMLADQKPTKESDDLPEVYWHPKFREMLKRETVKQEE